MKKKYEKPLLKTEEFVPQEYCSTCAGILCGTGLTKQYYVLFNDSNGNGSYDKGEEIKDQIVSKPCYDEHLKDPDELANKFECLAQPSNRKGNPLPGTYPIHVTAWQDDSDWEPGDHDHKYCFIAGWNHYTAKS